MSGQLVGEVIAAANRIKAEGLSERGFHALVAIAEKCHTESRQGSVPWIWIRRGLFGASKRTAERAVKELRSAGFVRVSATGFTNQHRSRAPIYEIPPLVDSDTAVSGSSEPDTDTAVSEISTAGYRQTESGYRQTEFGYRHSSVVLNGSINGSSNGAARERSPTPPPPPPPADLPEPNPWCDNHPGGTADPCRSCADKRLAAERFHADRQRRQEQERQERAAAIEACERCNKLGQRYGPDGLESDTPVRCKHTPEE